MATIKLIDVFSGAGGFTEGFVKTGRFRPVVAIELNPWAAKTYTANFGAHCAEGDINVILRKGLPVPKVGKRQIEARKLNEGARLKICVTYIGSKGRSRKVCRKLTKKQIAKLVRIPKGVKIERITRF